MNRQYSLTQKMKAGPFTVSTDGSNDDQSKQFPLVIRTVDLKNGKVSSDLLCIPVCDDAATGENIFKLLDAELKLRQVPWTNCLALGCDNASVMT